MASTSRTMLSKFSKLTFAPSPQERYAAEKAAEKKRLQDMETSARMALPSAKGLTVEDVEQLYLRTIGPSPVVVLRASDVVRDLPIGSSNGVLPQHPSILRRGVFLRLQQGLLDEEPTFKRMRGSGTAYEYFTGEFAAGGAEPSYAYRSRQFKSNACLEYEVYIRYQTEGIQPRTVDANHYSSNKRAPSFSITPSAEGARWEVGGNSSARRGLCKRESSPSAGRRVYACVFGHVAEHYFAFCTTDPTRTPVLRHLCEYKTRAEMMAHAREAVLKDLGILLNKAMQDRPGYFLNYTLKAVEQVDSELAKRIAAKHREKVRASLMECTPLYADVAGLVAGYVC